MASAVAPRIANIVMTAHAGHEIDIDALAAKVRENADLVLKPCDERLRAVAVAMQKNQKTRTLVLESGAIVLNGFLSTDEAQELYATLLPLV
jgi:TATA-box binding protein (TBP) (component of TFIID and TFIIIB)